MTATAFYLENALVPQNRLEKVVEAGQKIQHLAPEWVNPFVCFLNGEAVLRADWEKELEEGDVLSFIDVRVLPQGGGGGSDPVRAVLMIAVIIAAPHIAAAVFGTTGALAVAGVTIAGMTLVNALLPPPKPTSNQQANAMAAASPTYSLGAQGNSARLGGAIPEHFGRMIAYPDFAAQPYVEYINNEQYLYQLLCVGRGYYSFESVRIEDTNIGNFPDVAIEYVNPGGTVTLFPSNVVSSIEVTGQDMSDNNYIGPFIVNPSGTLANQLAVDFVMPRGLYYANDDGSLGNMTVSVTVEARQINDNGDAVSGWFNIMSGNTYGPWSDWTLVSFGFGATSTANTDVVEFRYDSKLVTVNNRIGTTVQEQRTYYKRTRTLNVGNGNFTFATNTPQRQTIKAGVGAGRYEVRVRRNDTKNTAARVAHDISWTGLRGYLQDARTFGDVTLLAVRMKASNSLSSTSSRKINVIATRMLPLFDGTSFSGPIPTRSIAAAIIYAARTIGLSNAQIDLQTIRNLDVVWAARGDYFDARFDNFITFWEAVTKIAQAGRAKPFMQGGVLRIMRDQAASIPVAMFSMRNIVKGSFSIDYLMPTPDTADAIKTTYFDNTIWKPASVSAALPGSVSAKPAKVDMFGITGRDQAYRESVYIAACNRYRRRIIKFSTEMEGFIPSFGDLISIQHDMPGWGQNGEVVSYDVATRTMVLSEPVTFKAGQTHYIALRNRDGSQHGPYVATQGVNATTIVLATAPTNLPYTGFSEERTHFSFGWADTYRQLARVVSIKPAGLTRVALECVNEDSNVHTADQGVFTPVRITSELAGYTNAPVIQGLIANKSPFARHKMTVSWLPAPWATSYLVEQSIDQKTWIRIAETTGTDLTTTAAGSDTTTYVRVAAVGLAQGAWSQTSYVMPALEDVSGLSILVDSVGTLIKWNQCIDADYSETEIRAGDSWDTGTLIARKSGVTHYLNYQKTGTITLWAKHFDVFKKQSANAATAQLVVTGPTAPTLSYQITGPAEVLTWTIPTSLNPIDRYEIRYGASWAAGTLVDATKANSYRRQVTFGGGRTYWVAAIDAAENYGTPARIDITVNVPGPVTGTRIEVVDNNALIYWAAPATGSLPVDKYEVRKGLMWESSILIGSNGNSTFTTIFEQASGNYVYWIAAVDTAGNYGTPFSLSAYINQPPDYILRASISSALTGGASNAVSTTDKGANMTIYDATIQWTGTAGATWQTVRGKQAFTAGKWYWETKQLQAGTAWLVGLANASANVTNTFVGQDANSWGFYAADGSIKVNGTTTVVTTPPVIGDVIGCAYDTAAGTLSFYKNGTLIGQVNVTGTLYPAWSLININSSVVTNFGAYPFAYSPPIGYGGSTNSVYTKGTLISPVNTVESWTQHYTDNGYTTPKNQVDAGFPLYLQPGQASGSYSEVIDYGATLPATTISVVPDVSQLAASVNTSVQISYSNTSATGPWIDGAAGTSAILASNFRWVKYTCTFTATTVGGQVRVNGITVKLSVKQRTDSGQGSVLTAATGAFVNFGYPFIQADTPVVQPNGLTPLIPVVNFVGGTNPTGFTVYLYDQAGNKQVGNFSWSVRGY